MGDFTPTLEPHPRHGIPSHGKPDKRPESGGEFFYSRGIGVEHCPCFVCGTTNPLSVINNIAAFVQCKESGERVVKMFQGHANLDYRDYEPDRVQVKVGGCSKHIKNLERLDELVSDGILTLEKNR